MKKLICLLLCLMIVAVPMFALANVSVEYNGTKVEFPDVQPEVKDGAPVLPLRAVFEAMGAGVYWEETDRMIMAQRGNNFVIMQIGSPVLFVGSAPATLNNVPYISSDRTMVGAEVIEQAFNAKVEWNAESNTVIITE